MSKLITKSCPICGKEFNTYPAYNQTYCSRSCVATALRTSKHEVVCLICGKVVMGYGDQKYCSKTCADAAKRGRPLHPPVEKICPVCQKSFYVAYSDHTTRFCSRICANKGMFRPHTHNISEQSRKKMSDRLKEQWKDPEFRANVVERMKTNNPSSRSDVVAKIKKTKELNGTNRINNFRYGNGKISAYEQKVYKPLAELGFVYNLAISTQLARLQYPDRRYAKNYKPDFVNLQSRLCIEIDGTDHNTKEGKRLDAKKTECLSLLGFQTIRFTHADIDEGRFDAWLSSYQNQL